MSTALTDIERFLAGNLQGLPGAAAYGWWRKRNPSAVPLNAGNPFRSSFPLQELADATRYVLENEGALTLQYGGGPLSAKLKDYLVAFSNERGLMAGGAELLVTQGSSHALELSMRTFLNAGDLIAVEAPCYMGVLAQFRNWKPNFISFDQDGEGLMVDQMEAQLAERRRQGLPMPKLFYTIPNYHNPSGCTMPVERRRHLLRLADEYDFLILEDDAYGWLGFDDGPPPSLRALDTSGRVIFISTLSKLIAPGVRTGWAIASPAIIARMSQINSVSNNLIHAVIAHFWSKGTMPERIQWLRGEYARRCKTLLGLMSEYMPPGCEWTVPRGGFFTWMSLPPGVSSFEIFQESMEAGCAYIPGRAMYVDGRGDDHIRLAFSYAEVEDMERGVRALGGIIKKYMK